MRLLNENSVQALRRPILMAWAFVFAAVASGCGDGSQAPAEFSANSRLQVAGQWMLVKYQDAVVSENEAAILVIEESGAAGLVQSDCVGAVKAARLSDSSLKLLSAEVSGCFVHFTAEAEANRTRIAETIREGARAELNEDSTLTLQSATAKLIFVSTK